MDRLLPAPAHRRYPSRSILAASGESLCFSLRRATCLQLVSTCDGSCKVKTSVGGVGATCACNWNVCVPRGFSPSCRLPADLSCEYVLFTPVVPVAKCRGAALYVVTAVFTCARYAAFRRSRWRGCPHLAHACPAAPAKKRSWSPRRPRGCSAAHHRASLGKSARALRAPPRRGQGPPYSAAPQSRGLVKRAARLRR